MAHKIAELNADAESLKRERSMLQVELAKAMAELDLSGRVVAHLEVAQRKLDVELSSIRALQVDSSRSNVELLSAVETFKTDRNAFTTQREDHERDLRGTIADLQPRTRRLRNWRPSCWPNRRGLNHFQLVMVVVANL
jgi:hypothetical protein